MLDDYGHVLAAMEVEESSSYILDLIAVPETFYAIKDEAHPNTVVDVRVLSATRAEFSYNAKAGTVNGTVERRGSKSFSRFIASMRL